MFPFVGAPMFYSSRRRKRKWTVVFSVEGAVAVSDVIGPAAPSSSGEGGRVVEGEEEEDGDEGTSAGRRGGGDEEQQHGRRRSIDLDGRRQGRQQQHDVGDASEPVILLPSSSSSLMASASTSASVALASSSSATLTILQPKKRRRRSSSVQMRGVVRSLLCDGGSVIRVRVPSLALVDNYVDLVSGLTLECLLEKCAKWNFNPFLLNRLSGGHAVITLGCKIFQTYQFHRVFQLDWTALMLCLRLIEEGYRNNPYHNSEHAADVAQAMHCFLQEPPLAAALDPLEKMACILAAFGHDLYHPGVNQKFLEGSRNFLCSLYHNVSVLENFHWRCLVSVVKESGLFDHLSSDIWRRLLHIFEVLVLATDMQRQQEYLNHFKPYSERGGPPHLAEADERLFVMQILIKCADIANPCRPWIISKEWSVRASTEFFNQGDLERKLSMPVTNFCDRYATSVPKIQSGFMEYVAQPLFADWDQYMRSPLSASMLRNLRSNCQNWNRMLREQVQQQEELAQQQQQQRQASPSSPSMSSANAQRGSSPHHIHHRTPPSASSSLEEMAELEMQRPDVLQKRRASSSALPRSRSPRSSVLDLPRRVSLPVSVGGGATLWTATANRRLYEALSTSDIANAPVRLRLSHSEVTEESDEDVARSNNDIAEGEEEEDVEEGENMDTNETPAIHHSDDAPPADGGCDGSRCGTPTPVTTSGAVYVHAPSAAAYSSIMDKNQQRRYSEPLVLTLANFCPVPSNRNVLSSAASSSSTTNTTKPKVDENGRLSMFLQRCMPRRGSLPMTQKELDDVQAASGTTMGGVVARSNSSTGPQDVPALLGRAVDVS